MTLHSSEHWLNEAQDSLDMARRQTMDPDIMQAWTALAGQQLRMYAYILEREAQAPPKSADRGASAQERHLVVADAHGLLWEMISDTGMYVCTTYGHSLYGTQLKPLELFAEYGPVKQVDV